MDGWIDHQKTMIKGGALGALLEFNYDFKITKGLYIG